MEKFFVREEKSFIGSATGVINLIIILLLYQLIYAEVGHDFYWCVVVKLGLVLLVKLIVPIGLWNWFL